METPEDEHDRLLITLLGWCGRDAAHRAFQPSCLEDCLDAPGSQLRSAVGVDDDDAVGALREAIARRPQ